MAAQQAFNPLRGGICAILGLFIGGSDLNNPFSLRADNPYKLTTQLHYAKQSTSSSEYSDGHENKCNVCKVPQ